MKIVRKNGHEFEVIKIQKNKHQMKDLFVCRDLKTGCKECFFRMDFQKAGNRYINHHKEALTEEDKELIEREILNRTERRKIYEMLNNRSFQAVQNYIAKVRKKYGIKAHENTQKRAILQYDAQMNLIGKYYSFSEASENSFVEPGCISKCCRGLQARAGIYYWKFEEDSE